MKEEKNKGIIKQQAHRLFSFINRSLFKIITFSRNGIANSVSSFADAKEKSKDLVKTNLELGIEHVQNNNLFDAKLRFKIVLMMDKQNFQAMCWLGYIYLKQQNKNKARPYFENALKIAPSQEEQKEIAEILQQINKTQNV